MATAAPIEDILHSGDHMSPSQRISRIRGGLPYSAIESLQQELQLSLEELSEVLDISPRTLHRRRDENRLKRHESDRVFRLARVLTHAVDVFGSTEKAARWFKRPHPVLDDMKPLEVFDTDLGTQLVDDLLTRIDYGVYS